MKKLDLNLDWNSAYQHNQDWNAAIDSEVFRIFANNCLKQDAKEEEENKYVPQPIVANLPYGDFQEHVKQIKKGIATLKSTAEEVEFEVEENPIVEKSSVKEEDLYNTKAGESPHLNIGLTEETMKSMKENAVHEKAVQNATKEVMEVYKQEEKTEEKKAPKQEEPKEQEAKEEDLSEAEKTLGLNNNIAYLISNLKVQG